VRVLTLNAQGFRDGVDRAAAVIRATDPDVAMLNEVFRGPTKRLAAESSRVSVFGSTRFLRGFGNALLLRERPRTERRFMLRRTYGYAPRGAVVAVAKSGIAFVAVHLGLEREERVRHAVELVDALRVYTMVVLAGDLNEGPDHPAARVVAGSYRDAFAAAGEGRGETFPASDPLHRIDYVFCSSELKPVRATVVPIAASDHLAVIVEIEVPS
jgi:endonuclease/exonuclease/phosphatase family metal-dependent hydrolase